MSAWDFSKLPKSEHARVIDAYNNDRYAELMSIHNEYKLTTEYFCCDAAPVVRWFKWAIANNVIEHDTKAEN